LHLRTAAQTNDTMAYHVYRIDCPSENRDIVLALLADAGLEAFEETDHGLDAYGNSIQAAEHLARLNELSVRYALKFSQEKVPDRNWNEEWESNFRPIRIGNAVYIRASFHEPLPEMPHDLVIDPKMAFGTGHHATTHMMCELILEGFAGEGPAPGWVLDYGSGTGVLSILAKRCGARHVDAVDVELAAAENTRDNCELNGVSLYRLLHGTLEVVPEGQRYDLILANINRNVLLETAAALYDRLRPGGKLLASGILEPDADLLVAHMRTLGLDHRETRAREDWRAFVFTRD
jgi:ribosomal protein L11 methyltransferase